MEDPPTPSSDGSQSRRGSHVDTLIHGIPAHPKHVDNSRRDSQAPVTIGDGVGDKKNASVMHREEEVNESSPLLAPAKNIGEETVDIPALATVASPGSAESWRAIDGPRQETKSSWYLLLLTLAIGGLQFCWSLESSYGSPYLLGLGISKSLLAFVWIAGPLSGTLVQPYVGIKSDRCRSRFGKRRPFMVGGAVATIISLMLLAWTTELVSKFLHVFGVAKDSRGTKIATIVFAIVMIYVLDFSINVIQAGIRAFIVDNAPTHQQDDANAWASRISSVGNILGYLAGYINLPRYFWWLGDTQFKILCVSASVAMIVTLTISCLSIKERDPRLDGPPSEEKGGVFAFFIQLWRSIRQLPLQVSRVCQVQFFAWIGWFPFLFYVTTYIGQIYVNPYLKENPHLSSAEIDALWEKGTRIGTLALFVFAITTFVASVLLPFIVVSTYKVPESPLQTPMTPMSAEPPSPVSPTTPAANAAEGYFDYGPAQSTCATGAKRRRLRRMWASIPSVEVRWLTLTRAWMLSHIMFAACMWLTFAVRGTLGAIILTGSIGVPWAMAFWAPFALIAAEISKRDNIRRGVRPPPLTVEGNERPDRDAEARAQGEDASDGTDQAGVVLGIHNVAIAAPQVIATLISSVIFKFMQKSRGTAGDNSTAWVLRFGGLCALVAAYLTTRVFDDAKKR